jgi:hypothetical protein
MKEPPPKIEQLGIFKENLPSTGAKSGESGKRRGKNVKLPEARGYNIIGGYAEKIINKTEKEHTCHICGNVIPPGSSAKEIIEVVNGKLLVYSKRYAHLKGRCLPPEQTK